MENKDFENTYFKKVRFIEIIEIFINLFLSGIKLGGGLLIKSNALISDGVDSISDTFTSFCSFIFHKKAFKKADEEHQFGHLKLENIISITISLLIFFTGLVLIYNGIISLINKEYLNIDNDNLLFIFIISLTSLLIKLITGLLIIKKANKLNSSLLKAQGIDHLLDSISSFIVLLVSLFIYIFKDHEIIKILDPIGSILISLILLYGAIKIYLDNASSLLDKAVSKKEEAEIKNIILSEIGVLHIDALRSFIASSFIFIELEISVKEDLSFKEAHQIAENIRVNLLNKNKRIKSVLVHVNPESHKNEETI